MNSSLDELAKNLIGNNDYTKCPHTKEHFKDKIHLVAKKGLYPYEYVQSHEDFNGGLPPLKDFYSSLSKSLPSEKDYVEAQKVYNEMMCKNFGDYHDIYLKTDVLLLTDIFMYFRKVILKE